MSGGYVPRRLIGRRTRARSVPRCPLALRALGPRPLRQRRAAGARAPARRRPRRVGARVTGLLAEHHDVIAVDMPGFGESRRSCPDDVPATAGAIADSIEATLDSLGIERAHVAGNSLGGWVALEFAKSRALPERDHPVRRRASGGVRSGPGRRSRAAPPVRLVPVLQAPAGHRARAAAGAARAGGPSRAGARAAAYRLVRAYALSPGFDRANAEMRRTLFTGFEDIAVPITMAWAEYDRSVSAPAQVPARSAHGVPRRLRPHAHVGRPAAGGRGDPRHHRAGGARRRGAALRVGGVNRTD